MNDTPNPIVFAVQSAVLELLELVEYISQNDISETKEELQQEVQKNVLMFIAAIVLTNKQYDPSRWPFLSILVDWRDLPGGEVRYLNEYATRWVEASKSTPHFIGAAIQYDLGHQTAIARAMLRQIQLIGNTVSAADGSVSPLELGTVRNYIEFLEEKIEGAKRQASLETVVSNQNVTEPPQKPRYSQSQSRPDNLLSRVVSPRKRNADLRWIPASDSITIGNYNIPAGMIYVSEGQSSIAEASAIDLQLPIGQASRGTHTQLS